MANEVETRMGAMLTAIILGEDYPSELNMSRIESILQSIIDNTEYDDPVYSRIEFLLLELKKKMEENPTIEELTVTQNGTYQEEGKAYSPVNVNVEGGPVIAELRVTENGTYEESGKAYSPVIVDVDEGPTIESLSVTANGTYSEEGKAYTPVVVNIEGYKLEDMPTGAIVTIADAAALPLNELKVAIEPVQSGSGDPSPQNEIPISGWTECNVNVDGKNLLPRIQGGTSKGVTCTVRDDGSLKFTMINPPSSSVQFYSKYFLIKAGIYKSNGVPSGGYRNYVFYLENVTGSANVGSDLTITIEKDTITRAIVQIYANGQANNIEIYPMLRKSTETATYEPYKGNTYNIQFPSSAGTVYGGTLDVTNGVLTVTYILIDMGTLTWRTSGATYLATSGIDSAIISTADIGQGFICSHYPPSTNWSLPDDKTMAIWTTQVRVKDTDYATPEAFKTAMNGVKLCYEVRVPQTYNLTPTEIKTLLGINNIFADCGDILEGEYFKEL